MLRFNRMLSHSSYIWQTPTRLKKQQVLSRLLNFSLSDKTPVSLSYRSDTTASHWFLPPPLRSRTRTEDLLGASAVSPQHLPLMNRTSSLLWHLPGCCRDKMSDGVPSRSLSVVDTTPACFRLLTGPVYRKRVSLCQLCFYFCLFGAFKESSVCRETFQDPELNAQSIAKKAFISRTTLTNTLLVFLPSWGLCIDFISIA